MPRFYVGLDLGQANDFSALTVIELKARVMQDGDAQPKPGHATYHVRMLERAPINTPYPRIAARVAELMHTHPLAGHSVLLADATGVGRPVVDQLRQAGASPIAITITGGDHVGGGGLWLRVPKRDLVSSLQVLLQSGRLKVANSLPHAATLVTELQGFRVRITAGGSDQYGTWREGDHDDLVLALSMATWYADRRQRLAASSRPLRVTSLTSARR